MFRRSYHFLHRRCSSSSSSLSKSLRLFTTNAQPTTPSTSQPTTPNHANITQTHNHIAGASSAAHAEASQNGTPPSSQSQPESASTAADIPANPSSSSSPVSSIITPNETTTTNVASTSNQPSQPELDTPPTSSLDASSPVDESQTEVPPPITVASPAPEVESESAPIVTTASSSAPAAFNAAAAAAAATGLPPPAVTTATTIAEQPSSTVTNEMKEPCPEEVSSPPSQDVPIFSQSPPAGLPLPFPSNHLLWLANGTQSTVGELFLSPPETTTTSPSSPANSQSDLSSTDNAATPSATAATVNPSHPPGRLVVVVGFVGAYLSLCQAQLPVFAQRMNDFRKRGVDTIYGVSVNDHAVLKSFAEDAGLSKLTLIADQDATFVRSLNLAMDLSAAGMGIRAKRFVMLVREGFVEEAWVESNPGELTVSSAESVLKRLPEIKKPTPSTTTAKVVAAVQAGMAAVTDRVEHATNGTHAATTASSSSEVQPSPELTDMTPPSMTEPTLTRNKIMPTPTEFEPIVPNIELESNLDTTTPVTSTAATPSTQDVASDAPSSTLSDPSADSLPPPSKVDNIPEDVNVEPATEHYSSSSSSAPSNDPSSSAQPSETVASSQSEPDTTASAVADSTAAQSETTSPTHSPSGQA